MQSQGPPASTVLWPRRGRTSNACTNCAEAKERCDEGPQPCSRCVARDITCMRRRRKRSDVASQAGDFPRIAPKSPEDAQEPTHADDDFMNTQTQGSSSAATPDPDDLIHWDLPADTDPRQWTSIVPVNAFEQPASPSPSAITMEGFNPLDLWLAYDPLNEGLVSILSVFGSCPFPVTLMDVDALQTLNSRCIFPIGGTKSANWSTHAILLQRGVPNPMVLRLALAASQKQLSTKEQFGVTKSDSANLHYLVGRDMMVDTSLVEGQQDTLHHLQFMMGWWFWHLFNWHGEFEDPKKYQEMSRQACAYFRRHGLHKLVLDEAWDSPLSTDTESLAQITCIARLTSWLFWEDAAAWVFGQGGTFARLLFETSPHGLSSLYGRSKPALRYHWTAWGPEGYPIDEMTDDEVNGRLLELLHQTWVLGQRINTDLQYGPLDVRTSQKIAEKIEYLLTHQFSDIVEQSKSQQPRERILRNVDWAVSHLYALCIYWGRASLSSGDATDATRQMLLQSPVAKLARKPLRLINLLYQSLAGDTSDQRDRLQWPLFWAGIQSGRGPNRDWALARIMRRWMRTAAQRVVEEQDASGAWLGVGRIRELCQSPESVSMDAG